MATKKQKRAAAQAKREAFLAEVKADGLKALEGSRQRQKKADEIMTQAAKEINEHRRAILHRHGINPGTGIAYDELKRANAFAEARYIAEHNPGTPVRVED
jgi:hypothetical protein